MIVVVISTCMLFIFSSSLLAHHSLKRNVNLDTSSHRNTVPLHCDFLSDRQTGLVLIE